MLNQINFQNVHFDVIEHREQLWLTASEIAYALGYKKSDAVTQIYDRNSDEFTSTMTETLKMSVSGNLTKSVRIFSLRGAHLIAMFSRTKVAKEFRKWALNILDEELKRPQRILPPSQYQLPASCLPNFYDSGWLPAHYERCHSETHWTYHIKFQVRPIGGKFSAKFELGIGGKGKTEPHFSSSGAEFIDSGFYLEYRDIEELWENIRLVLEKYRAHSPY